MKRKTVLVIYNEEELQKVNDQLAFMQEQPILNSGKFPRYFKVTEMNLKRLPPQKIRWKTSMFLL